MELNPKYAKSKKKEANLQKNDLAASSAIDNKMNKHLLQLILNKIRQRKQESQNQITISEPDQEPAG